VTEPDDAARAREWLRAAEASVCDVIEPWEHGHVLRATRYPHYFDFNNVSVDRDADLSAEELARFADEALDGLNHRRVDVEPPSMAERLTPEFLNLGWHAVHLVWMRHSGPRPSGYPGAVEQVAYDAVRHLRAQWLREDFPELDPTRYLDESREVAGRLGAEVLAAFDRGAPVAFAQLERARGGAEIANVYVLPQHRGEGLGTALTEAAITAAGDVEDLWIVADDEGRPKELYGRLGFLPVWTRTEFLLPHL
jgi:GNAT superfamily N-acetyltransferase